MFRKNCDEDSTNNLSFLFYSTKMETLYRMKCLYRKIRHSDCSWCFVNVTNANVKTYRSLHAHRRLFPGNLTDGTCYSMSLATTTGVNLA